MARSLCVSQSFCVVKYNVGAPMVPILRCTRVNAYGPHVTHRFCTEQTEHCLAKQRKEPQMLRPNT